MRTNLKLYQTIRDTIIVIKEGALIPAYALKVATLNQDPSGESHYEHGLAIVRE